LWNGRTEIYSSKFTGDSKTFRIRWDFKHDDGTVAVYTDEAPIKFLQITDPVTAGFHGPDCSGSGDVRFAGVRCVAVACLFGRKCISSKMVHYDPVYHDPKREGTESFPNSGSEAMGYVNPMNGDKVTEALRTLIRLNAVPPSNPPVTQPSRA
jgi:hypothetical protein